MFAQLFNALNARSDLRSAFDHLFNNPWLWGSILFAIVAQVAVVEVPPACRRRISNGSRSWRGRPT